MYVSLHVKLLTKFKLKIKYALDSKGTEVNTCLLYHYHKCVDSCTVICCAYNTLYILLPYVLLLHVMSAHCTLCLLLYISKISLYMCK